MPVPSGDIKSDNESGANNQPPMGNSFRRNLIETCRFADNLVAVLCRDHAHKVVVHIAVKAVLDAHVLILNQKTTEAQILIDAAYKSICNTFARPAEMWDMVMRISTNLNNFAMSEVKSAADYIIFSRMRKQHFLARVMGWGTKSEISLIEHIGKLRPEKLACANNVLHEYNLRYFAVIGMWAWLLLPAAVNALYLGVWTEPHSLLFRISAVVPCVSWFVLLNMLPWSVGFSGTLSANLFAFLIGVGGFGGLCGGLEEKKIDDLNHKLDLSSQGETDTSVSMVDSHAVKQEKECTAKTTASEAMVHGASVDASGLACRSDADGHRTVSAGLDIYTPRPRKGDGKQGVSESKNIYTPVSKKDNGVSGTKKKITMLGVTRIPLTSIKGNWKF